VDEDAWCWREAARLRGEHRGWVVIWLSAAHEFRACGRLPGARRDTVLPAATPARLAALIGQAEQAAGLDDDGYVTVSYWNDPDATTVQIIEGISRVLSAIPGPS
jgi:hypothetical protein